MKYFSIAEHYKQCFLTHGDTHLGVDWPKYEDTLTRYQVMLDIVKESDATLLDFGCGTAELNSYRIKSGQLPDVKYSGLDINSEFINRSMEKFPEADFYTKDILTDDNIPTFDYIVCNGVFTEKLSLSYDEMMDFFSSSIKALWNRCNKGIAFNLMSKQVDWERDDLFHVSLDEIAWFAKNNMSRNFIIRNDYKLYEYTVYVYR